MLAPVTIFVASRTLAAGDLTPKEARRLIARMAGIQLPSDAVRIKEISSLGNSATVTAQVETAFRFVKGDKDQWRVAEIRTGDRRWEDLDTLMRALNAEKTARARATVLLNGVKIYDNQELERPHGAASRLGEAPTGPLMLQEHGMPVQFRNIWLIENPEKMTKSE